MKINLSPEAISAIAEIQEDDYIVSCLLHVEEFLHEIYGGEDGEEAVEFMMNIKCLRNIRKIIEKIYRNEEN